MPFLIPLAGLIPALAGGGALAASTLLGRRGGRGGASGGAGGAEAELAQSAAGARTFGESFAPQSREAFQSVFDYYKPLLGGDRTAIMQLLAPEIRQVTGGYEQALQSRELAPRGGGTAQMFAQLPFNRARDIASIYQEARPRAAAGMSDLAEMAASTVLGGYGVATRGQAARLQYLLGQRQQSIGIGESVGRGIFSLLRLLGIGGGG